jgi:hypothetical protein
MFQKIYSINIRKFHLVLYEKRKESRVEGFPWWVII